MSEPKNDKHSMPYPGLGPQTDQPPANADEVNSDEIAREAAQIAGLHAEMVELKDRYLRSVAEVENLRKRSDRERHEVAQFAFARFARDLITVLDNFTRALDAVKPEARAALPASARSILEGIEATQREMLAIFERHGIKRIEAKGQRFDPNLHSAIAEVPTSEYPPGTVIDVAQHGYTIGGRLLREAMVTVAAPPAVRDGANGGDSEGPGIDTSA
jgi:molecular chaperone GrpE